MDIHILTSEREELNKAIADKDAEIKKLFERQPPLDAALLTVQAGVLQEQYKYLHDCKSKVVAQLAAAAAAQPQPDITALIREEGRLTRMAIQDIQTAASDVEVTASQCSSQHWNSILMKLQHQFNIKLAQLPPCCLGTIEPATACGQMVWDPSNDENATANIKKMVAHLETEVCPEGTRVWPVQNDGWLAACINCGAAGKIKISMSKTDYIVLTQGAWDDLHELTKEGIQITGHHLTDKLPQVIALYEAKTTMSLKKEPGKAVRQGLLELLAADDMRACADHLVVLMGDGNIHYGIHFSEAGDGNLHVIVPNQMARISEHGTGATHCTASDRGTLASAQTLLERVLSRTLARLGAQGTTLSISTGSGGSGASGSSGGPGGTGGPFNDSHAPQAKGGGGHTAAPGGMPGSTAGSGHPAAGTAQAPSLSHTPTNTAAGDGRRSEHVGSCEGEGEDEGLREAWQDQLRMERLVQVLRTPGVCADLDLPAPPSSIQPLTKDAYAKALRPMIPDGSGGWLCA